MDKDIRLSKNAVVAYLQKAPADFTKADIIDFVANNGIEMINFMYPAADGRLKTLNFVINNLAYLETILTLGERVDGSSLFPFIEAGSSDLYVIPRFRTAFVDPFASLPTLTMLCSYFDKDGKPLESAPENMLDKACRAFTEVTGLHFHAMGELEYYVIAPDPGTFPATDQRGYHESAPFAKFNDFRTLCMSYIARTGAQIKYGHSEVGNFTLDGKVYEQNEIEFLPVDARDAADQLMLAKWVIRNLAQREGLDITFAPKITVGKAGSGLHIHMKLTHADGSSAMLAPDGSLSDDARRAIAGLMDLASALTAFGNANPTSYFRLVPHQEAPTNICWGDRNRSVLVRVPLGWTAKANMCAAANGAKHATPCDDVDAHQKQTFEIRSADCSADIYQLIAGLAVAVRHGFEMSDALEVAERQYVDIDIHKPENAAKLASLPTLPANCPASADCLEARESIFEEYGVFPAGALKAVEKRLRAFDGERYARALAEPELMLEIVREHFYCG
ncbi:MAG: glutamine synthetase family protein [Muribaculaceae bacterium]|nr:glutamine synthetase family protein [Muribaculaceae bacterium]